MSYVKHRWPFFLAMLVLWFLFNFNFQIETIVFGTIISLLMTIFAANVLYDENGFRFQRIKIPYLVLYIFVVFFEIFKSAFKYILSIMKRDYEAVVFVMNLDVEDPIEVGMIANSITLTPGTVTIDVNGSDITVMAIAKKGTPAVELEKPIRERFEKLLKKGARV